jgi:thiol:disulfide interchange protein DsbC
MISKFCQTALLVLSGLLCTVSLAGEPVPEAEAAKIRAALEVGERALKVESVTTSEIPGLYAVQFERGPMVYATRAGEFFIVGDLFSTGPAGYVNLTEKRRDDQRMSQLAAMKSDDMIIFAADGKRRATVTVFTDVTCFYCQKLHKEVPELNKRGVEVRYLAYPRAGVGSDGYRQLASAWCAANPQDAITRLKSKQKVPENVCADNPVAAQYALGQEMGVRGTPAIITEKGEMIPGYQSADDLMVTLGLE